MIKRSLKRKLLRARIKLNHTVDQILTINKNRKRLNYTPIPDAQREEQALDEELKVLNKLAEQQARLVKHYETALTEPAG